MLTQSDARRPGPTRFLASFMCRIGALVSACRCANAGRGANGRPSDRGTRHEALCAGIGQCNELTDFPSSTCVNYIRCTNTFLDHRQQSPRQQRAAPPGQLPRPVPTIATDGVHRAHRPSRGKVANSLHGHPPASTDILGRPRASLPPPGKLAHTGKVRQDAGKQEPPVGSHCKTCGAKVMTTPRK